MRHKFLQTKRCGTKTTQVLQTKRCGTKELRPQTLTGMSHLSMKFSISRWQARPLDFDFIMLILVLLLF